MGVLHKEGRGSLGNVFALLGPLWTVGVLVGVEGRRVEALGLFRVAASLPSLPVYFTGFPPQHHLRPVQSSRVWYQEAIQGTLVDRNCAIFPCACGSACG